MSDFDISIQRAGSNHPLIVLLGPTASGKTALSLHLAQHFSGEIVSCDSVAVYRDLEIGTAKPSRAERSQIPHHLIDVADPSEAFTAGDYSRLARAALAAITAHGKLPIVTGGTGLYLRALIDGLFEAPPRSEDIRQRLRRAEAARGAGWLHRILARLDPAASRLIHANDTPKLVRAIEVCLTSRQPMTQAWQSGRDGLRGYKIIRIGLNPGRQALYSRINARAAAMFQDGLVEETRYLVEKYGPDVRPLTSLGYKQALAVIHGDMSNEEAIKSAQQGHRNYAKRQLTWFRREPEVHWLNSFGDEAGTQAEAIRLVTAIENDLEVN
ncbi:tRNA dimethylallyltransferase [Acidisarcina polymorpha]|uniref:tRNA dimethylallyltransferase n=1 Tax=Acidisarcina polymorpha TaxID=2211140 RepID=A0A2Z5FYA1_9BACT|nr:tRNA (adenosine(37)-N6)-dimethylallyltransferase MiaA [Acidisarcina polymorpha]AXC11447.1 tRNA dimethylallyltransferase [Acidisarcina polymorpha]